MHFECPPKWRDLVITLLVPHETAAVSAHVLCTPYNHAPVYSITSCEATCIRRLHMCLDVTCHLRFWQNDRDLLRATAVTRGWNVNQNKESAQKVDPGEENSPIAPVGTRTGDLSLTRPALYHRANPWQTKSSFLATVAQLHSPVKWSRHCNSIVGSSP